MRKVGNHQSFLRIFFNIALTLFFSLSLIAQEATTDVVNASPATETSGGDALKGKELFNTNCAACHKLDAKSTGPALRGVADKYDRVWLQKWIRNSGELIKSGDAQAIKIFEENNKVPMTAFPQLSDADIDNILAYTSEKAPVPVAATVATSKTSDSSGAVSNNVLLGVLTLIMVMLIVMLYMVYNMLKRIALSKDLEINEKDRSLNSVYKAFVKNQFLVLVSAIAFLLIGAYLAYGYFMQIGVDQGYEPVQPIHYSHKIHAGDNGIDCKYCHSSARVSKSAGIPSLNVCMNCHKNISEVAETTATAEHSKAFYDEQIQKLYDAVGWDKDAQAYTGKTKPVKWVRIHNLPDFAYFNHSQHVSVAGIECQTCHGKVETFELMKQDQPLTMGWCINCHRETNIKVEDNEYYKKIHEELSKKYGVNKLTAAQMGGLECGKCHY